MRYAIVYSSKTGNTKLLAEAIQQALPKEDCIYFGPLHADAWKADRIYVGFWTDKGSCDEQTTNFLKSAAAKEIFLFGTAGFGENQAYFDKVLKSTCKHLPKSAKQIGSFMCQGKMPLSVRERYEKMLQSPIPVPHIQKMIENFDKALAHPTPEDLQNCQKAVQKAEESK